MPFDSNISTDAIEASKALTGSLESLMSAVSAPAMATAASGLKTLAEGINAVAIAAKENPGAAMAGGAVAAGGALAGSAWLGYKVLTGFGLPASAAALDTSAAALTAAAAELTAAAAASTGKSAVTGAVQAAEAGTAGAGGAAGLTLGGIATGAMLGAGALAGGLLDMATPGQNAGIVGTITGQESSLAQTMKAVRADRASADLARGNGPTSWSSGQAKVLPEAPGGTAYKTEVGFSRGMVGDFLWGKDKRSVELPGVGSLAPKVDAHGLDGLSGPVGAARAKAADLPPAERTMPGGWSGAKAKLLPEAPSGTGYSSVELPGAGSLAPKVDAHELDGLTEKFGEVKAKTEEVNGTTIAPKVEAGGLAGIIAQLQQIIGLAQAANAATGSVSGPSGGGGGGGGGGDTGRVRAAQGNNH